MRSERLVPLFIAIVMMASLVTTLSMMFKTNNNKYSNRSGRYYNGIDLKLPKNYFKPFKSKTCDIFCWLRWKKHLEGLDTFRLIEEQIQKDEQLVKWTQKQYQMTGQSARVLESDCGYVLEGSAFKKVPTKEVIFGIAGVAVCMLAL
ncbi:hypothetical protein BZA77DRAFT_358751 [Pyronema omphalodes]|nr:hypothetical protein BZA77DRAFT_358751 [Pyronema omphalodes]